MFRVTRFGMFYLIFSGLESFIDIHFSWSNFTYGYVDDWTKRMVVKIQVLGFVATHAQNIQLMAMMICKCLMMLMLLIDRCLLWRTPSMVWYHIKFCDIMKYPQDIGEAVYHKFVLWKLSDVGAICHVTLKVTYKMYTALNSKKHSVNTMYHRKILSVLSYHFVLCVDVTPKEN